MSSTTATEASGAGPRPQTPPNTIQNDPTTVERVTTPANDGADDISAAESSKIVENDSGAAVLISHIDVPMSPHIRSLRQIELLETKFDEGYDSDGESGPFIRMEDVEGEQIFDENGLPEVAPTEEATAVTVESGDGENKSEEPRHVPIKEDDLKKMSRDALKDELRLRGQALLGKKTSTIGEIGNSISGRSAGGKKEEDSG